MNAALRPLDLDDLGELFEQEREAAVTPSDALRDEYLAWREDRGLEPPFSFTRLVQQFHAQVDEVGAFPYVEMTGPR